MVLKIVRKKSETRYGIYSEIPFSTEYYSINTPLIVKHGTVDKESCSKVWLDYGKESVLEHINMQIDAVEGDRCIFFKWGDTKLIVSHEANCYLMENGKTIDKF